MANSLNVVVMTGRLTKDPEIAYTGGGTAYAKFGLAVNVYNGTENVANFFNWTAWGKSAEFVSNYTAKGDLLAVEGNARQNTYTDKNGANRSSIDFSVSRVSLLRKKGDGVSNEQQPPKEQPPAKKSTGDDLEDGVRRPQYLTEERQNEKRKKKNGRGSYNRKSI